MQIGEDINLHLSEKSCYGSDRRNLREMALNLRLPIKMTLTGAKGTVLIFSHTYGTSPFLGVGYVIHLLDMPSHFWYQFSIAFHTHICMCA